MNRFLKGLAVCALLTLALSSTALAAWSTPANWEHNTKGVERMPWLVDKTLYYVKDYDIYQSTWNGQSWSEPVPVPGKVNTLQNELNPAVIKGGTVMYFLRYGPVSDYDFYRSEWDQVAQEWGEPVKIEVWSTPEQDWDVWVNEAETLAYVTSKAGYGDEKPLGGRDIWRSERVDGQWTTPVNVGPPINSTDNEWSVFADEAGRIYFDSPRAGSLGNVDLWVAESLAGPISNLTDLNSPQAEREIAIYGDMAVISADRRDGGQGGYDLWVSFRQ